VRVAKDPAEQDRFQLLASTFEPAPDNAPAAERKDEPPPARTPGPVVPALK
jgi:hypothetical protein